MKKSKVIEMVTAATLCAAVLLTGCSSMAKKDDSDDDEYEDEDEDEEEETTESRETEDRDPTPTPTPSPTPTPTPTPKPDVDLSDEKDYAIIQPFSEGYAWISYYSDGINAVTQLVDEEGYAYYEDDGVIPDYVSPVVDGVTWIRYGDAIWDSGWVDTATEYIIDTNGKVLYETKQVDNDKGSVREHIIGYGNGKFLVFKITSGLEGEKYYIGTIDKTGNIIDDFWEAYGLYFCGNQAFAEYLQDDYFRMGDFIYDPGTQTCIYLDMSSEYGRQMFGYSVYDGVYYCDGGASDFVNAIAYDDDYPWYKPELLTVEELNDIGVIHTDSYSFYNDENVYYPDDLSGPYYQLTGLRYYEHGYYDKQGNLVLAIEQYPDLSMWCSDFNEDGYAIMILQGEDYYNYITVINQNGEEQFEPFRILYDSSPYYTDQCNFSGYVLNDCFVCQTSDGLCLYDVTGNRKKVLVSRSIDLDSSIYESSLQVTWFDEDYVIAEAMNDDGYYSLQYIFY